jgi:hypothetical protein
MLRVLRRYGGRILEEKGSQSAPLPAVVDPRLADLHGANAGGDRPFGQVAVADYLPMAAGILEVAT